MVKDLWHPSNMSQPPLGKLEILQLFKDSVLKFFDALITLFPEEGDLIVMRILFEDRLPIDESMKRFTFKIIPHKETIEKRDDKFFLTDNTVFGGIDSDKVIRWRNLWTSKRLDKDDRDSIWLWMDLFVRLCDMYLKHETKGI